MTFHFRTTVVILISLAMHQARATGIPVIDAAALVNSAKQVSAWAEQSAQMTQQINSLRQQLAQAEQTYRSLNGARGMGSLANDPSLRYYLPPEWNQTLSLLNQPGAYSGLSGSISEIRSAAKILSLEDTGLAPTSAAGQAFVAAQNQAAMNRALGEAGYRASNQRIAAIQLLMDKVNDAPDQKDIQDLQARIQAEQVMLQNEHMKLALMSQLQQAQRDIAQQRAREISMQSTRGTMPPGW